MKFTQSQLRKYLLGSLGTQQSEAIDLKIISQPEFAEELGLAEDNLMEDYLEEALTQDEIELFHKNFLVSEARTNCLRQLSLLKNYARKIQPNRQSGDLLNVSSDIFFQRLKHFFGLALRPAFAVSAILVLGLIIGIIFYKSSENNELAELNQRNLADLSEYKNFSILNLAPGTFRDTTDANKLPVEKLTDRILLRLILPNGINSETVFKVEVSIEQKNVLTLNNIRSYQNLAGQELRLILLSTLLDKGSYQIKATPEKSNEAPVIYTFTVQ